MTPGTKTAAKKATKSAAKKPIKKPAAPAKNAAKASDEIMKKGVSDERVQKELTHTVQKPTTPTKTPAKNAASTKHTPPTKTASPTTKPTTRQMPPTKTPAPAKPPSPLHTEFKKAKSADALQDLAQEFLNGDDYNKHEISAALKDLESSGDLKKTHVDQVHKNLEL